MSPKAHGTSATPVQQNLRWNCDPVLADRICNFNRRFAESAGDDPPPHPSSASLPCATVRPKRMEAPPTKPTPRGRGGGAPRAGYWESTALLEDAGAGGPITFYDSNTGKPLFVAPRGRSLDAFVSESRWHGWPSFRDDEVVWDNVRCLRGGETVRAAPARPPCPASRIRCARVWGGGGGQVSVDGTHLGHNLPDSEGNRYCINLVSIAGRPPA